MTDKKAQQAITLMLALEEMMASTARISKILDGEVVDHKEKDKQIINQRRRQQYKK